MTNKIGKQRQRKKISFFHGLGRSQKLTLPQTRFHQPSYERATLTMFADKLRKPKIKVGSGVCARVGISEINQDTFRIIVRRRNSSCCALIGSLSVAIKIFTNVRR